MTLAMAWVRDAGECKELIFCSDSRLRFGCAWDSGQKVFPLSRGDCAIAFAGDTKFAYPFVHAAMNAVTFHRGSARRQVDLFEVKSVLLNAMNAMLSDIHDLARGQDRFEEPDLRFIFGGFSWKKGRFAIWKFHFNPGEREFRESEIHSWETLGERRQLAIIGEPNASWSSIRKAARTGQDRPQEKDDVERMAKTTLIELLDERGLRNSAGLDMEPFEVLVKLLKTRASPHVGGSPQLLKIYQHLNAQPFGLHWPDSTGRVAVLGRMLPPGEKMHLPLITLEALESRDEGSEQVVQGLDCSSS
jgi:hypothetical protein